jgi:hypothetical protein
MVDVEAKHAEASLGEREGERQSHVTETEDADGAVPGANPSDEGLGLRGPSHHVALLRCCFG